MRGRMNRIEHVAFDNGEMVSLAARALAVAALVVGAMLSDPPF
jgi:hypothetical protein